MLFLHKERFVLCSYRQGSSRRAWPSLSRLYVTSTYSYVGAGLCYKEVRVSTYLLKEHLEILRDSNR